MASTTASTSVVDGALALTVAVIGAGTMGKRIAQLLSDAGQEVSVFDQDADQLAQWLTTVRESAADADRGATIREAASVIDAVRGADLVIEAVSEALDVKRIVLQAISAAVSPTCVIATNTSSFPIDVLASSCDRPSRFVGMHFFNPADVVPGVEVIAGRETDAETTRFVCDLLTRVGKRPAVVKSSPGFIANRLQLALFLESLLCVEEGLVSPEDLDTIVSTTFGFRLPLFGPFAIADMAGLDVYESILANLRDGYGARFTTPAALADLTAEGHFGLKTGQGFRSYDEQTRTDLPVRRDRMYADLDRALRAIQGDDA